MKQLIYCLELLIHGTCIPVINLAIKLKIYTYTLHGRPFSSYNKRSFHCWGCIEGFPIVSKLQHIRFDYFATASPSQNFTGGKFPVIQCYSNQRHYNDNLIYELVLPRGGMNSTFFKIVKIEFESASVTGVFLQLCCNQFVPLVRQ